MNKIDKLLTLFCYNEEPACDREWMRKPMLYNGFVYATNREALIKVHPSLCSEQYGPYAFTVDHITFKELEGYYKERKEPVSISLAALSEALSKIEKVAGKKICADCKGTGESKDVLEDETLGCFTCEGFGTVEDPDNLIYPDTFDHVVRISKTPLSPKYAGLLETVCKVVECDHFTIKAVWYKMGVPNLMYQIGEVTVLIMSLYLDEDQDKVKTFHEIKLPELQNH